MNSRDARGYKSGKESTKESSKGWKCMKRKTSQLKRLFHNFKLTFSS